MDKEFLTWMKEAISKTEKDLYDVSTELMIAILDSYEKLDMRKIAMGTRDNILEGWMNFRHRPDYSYIRNISDLNGDGKITCEEFGTVFGRKCTTGYAVLMRTQDSNGDGMLDVEEYVEFVKNMLLMRLAIAFVIIIAITHARQTFATTILGSYLYQNLEKIVSFCAFWRDKLMLSAMERSLLQMWCGCTREYAYGDDIKMAIFIDPELDQSQWECVSVSRLGPYNSLMESSRTSLQVDHNNIAKVIELMSSISALVIVFVVIKIGIWILDKVLTGLRKIFIRFHTLSILRHNARCHCLCFSWSPCIRCISYNFYFWNLQSSSNNQKFKRDDVDKDENVDYVKIDGRCLWYEKEILLVLLSIEYYILRKIMHLIAAALKWLKDRTIRSHPFNSKLKVPKKEFYGNGKGLCMVINQRDFSQSGHRHRHGTDKDRDDVKDTFLYLGVELKDMKVYNDLSDTEMRVKLEEMARTANTSTEHAWLAVVILSHGRRRQGEDEVMGVNWEGVTVTEIVNMFTIDCPNFQNKPKFFWIQACRTDIEVAEGNVDDHFEDNRVMEDSAVNSDPSVPTLSNRKPALANCLVHYATVPKFESYRNVNEGSFFIQNLCRVLRQNADTMNLDSMLKIVNKKVTEHNLYYPSLPEYNSCLLKEFKFKTIEETCESNNSQIMFEIFFLMLYHSFPKLSLLLFIFNGIRDNLSKIICFQFLASFFKCKITSRGLSVGFFVN